MSALSKDVVIRLLGDAKSAQDAIKAAADAAEVSVGAYRRAEREQARQTAVIEENHKRQAESMRKVGEATAAGGLVIAAGLAMTVKAAIDWQSAWAGVTKVTSGTPQQMEDLEKSLRGLATTLPATHEEIAGVAEAAGQLGVAREDLVEFTKTAIALGVSTNLSAEDAATGLAQLANITGTSMKDVDRMGATLVALGNQGASTESDILAMSLRLAAAGRQANMSDGDIMGLANAMSSMGIEAEAGGTAASRVIKDINSSVIAGGSALSTWAELAGMSSEKFAQSWKANAAGTLVEVERGLARVQAAGGDVNSVLADLGENDIRVQDTMLRLSGGADLLADSLKTGNQAWADNSALMNEANKRYATTASQLKIAQNNIDDAAISIGDTLLPVLGKGASLVADFAKGWQELPGWMKDAVAIIGAAAAVVATLGGAAIIAVPKIAAFRAEMARMAEGAGLSAMLGKFGAFMTGPWGAAIGIGVAALGPLITMLGATSQASQEARQYTEDLAGALRQSKGAIDDNVRSLAAKKAEDSGLLEMANKVGVALPTVTDALLGNKGAYDKLSGAIKTYRDVHSSVSQDDSQALYMDDEGKSADGLLGKLTELSGGMGEAVAKNQRLADASADTADKSKDQAAAADKAGKATLGMSDQAQSAADALSNLAKALDAINKPELDLRESTAAYQEAIDKANKSLQEHGKNLDITTEAGRANQGALDDLAKAAQQQATAVLNSTGSYDAFRSSLMSSREQLVKTAENMGYAQKDAEKLANQILQIPDAADVQISLPGYDTTVGQLIDVQRKLKGLPPHTPVTVDALTQDAENQLGKLGFHVQHMPDGSVRIWADTGSAYDGLNAFLRTPAVKVVKILTDSSGASTGINYSNHTQARAGGGPVWPGEPFLVGEHGPELVTFTGHGTVLPADQTASLLGGQPAASTTMPIAGTPMASAGMTIDFDALAAAIARALPTSLGGVHIKDFHQAAEGATPHETAEALTFMARGR